MKFCVNRCKVMHGGRKKIILFLMRGKESHPLVHIPDHSLEMSSQYVVVISKEIEHLGMLGEE